MSSVRPGTVDYSHFDHIGSSSDEEDDISSEEQEDGSEEFYDDEEDYFSEDDDDDDEDYFSEDDDDDDEEEEDEDYGEDEDDSDSDESGEDHIVAKPRHSSSTPVRRAPSPAPATVEQKGRSLPDLATLQGAWGRQQGAAAGLDDDSKPPAAGATTTTSVRLCASCSRPSPPYRCSRCKSVWYCNAYCQRRYSVIHRSECIDASSHFAFWGAFQNSNNTKAAQTRGLQARLRAKRRRALKRAAARAAIERARLARERAASRHGGAPAANKGGGGKGKGASDEAEVTCTVCQCEYTVSGDGGVGLTCPASHRMCAECTGVYVSSILGDMEASYPPKCPMCRALMPSEHFERQLDARQQTEVRAFVARKALKPGEKMLECNRCGFFEVRSDDPVVWFCGGCTHGMCFVCNKAVNSMAERSIHYDVCRELRLAKTLVEGAIEKGSKCECPGCGLAGRKDEACTHMTCPKCATVWCYVCGLDAKTADKAPRPSDAPADRPIDDIYLHNREWETLDSRCPMYLTQILEVDTSWLGDDWENDADDDDFDDDEKCLDYFHRFKTIKLLQQVRESVGEKKFAQVFEQFDSIRNSGYSVDEIVSTDTENLIDREDFLRYHQQEREEEAAMMEGADGDNMAAADDDFLVEMPDEETMEMIEEDQIRRAIEISRAAAEVEEDNIRRATESSLEDFAGGSGRG